MRLGQLRVILCHPFKNANRCPCLAELGIDHALKKHQLDVFGLLTSGGLDQAHGFLWLTGCERLLDGGVVICGGSAGVWRGESRRDHDRDNAEGVTH